MSSYGEFLLGDDDLFEAETEQTVQREDDAAYKPESYEQASRRAKREKDVLREAKREEGFTRA